MVIILNALIMTSLGGIYFTVLSFSNYPSSQIMKNLSYGFCMRTPETAAICGLK